MKQGFLYTLCLLICLVGWSNSYGHPHARGINNNNPGNIKCNNSNDWRGSKGCDSSGFVVFEHHIWGLRAMSRVLDSYVSKGYNDLNVIILRWTNNDSNAVRIVASKFDNDKFYQVHMNGRWESMATKIKLMKAIVYMENGEVPYNNNEFQTALRL